MKFTHSQYVPCLRWKMGEYQAVFGLPETVKNNITPLIEIPELGYDFEEQKESKTLDEHLEPFAKRVAKKWGVRPCFVDFRLLEPERRMKDGQHPVSSIFAELTTCRCNAIPVIGPNRDSEYQNIVIDIVKNQQKELCIRLSVEEASKPNLLTFLDTILRKAALSANQAHLVLDLGAPNFVPIAGFSKLVVALIRRLPHLSEWQSLSMIGTAFPESMGTLELGTSIVERSEWILYKIVARELAKIRVRVPSFGDYAINHPRVSQMDMRLIKPAGTIRYTVDDAWFIVKGPNIRNAKGLAAFRKHCRDVIQSNYYNGNAFSEGDNYIQKCANGNVSTGNATVWRRVGTSHHLHKVTKDVATFADALSTQ